MFCSIFFRVGPRGKISFESFTKNYSYHCVTVSYFYDTTSSQKTVLRSQFKSFKSKCSPRSIGNRENYDLEHLSRKSNHEICIFFFS